MEPQYDAGQAVPRNDRMKLFWSLGLALFWVTFLWGFFSRGIYAMGTNAFVYLAATLALFLWTMRHEGVSLRKNAVWIAPVFLIISSYLLYDNPFLKIVNLLALPTLFTLFYNEAFLSARGRARWGRKTIEALVWRALSIVTHVRKAGDLIERSVLRARKDPSTAKRVVMGSVIFLLVAVVVVIPLLSAADPAFAAAMGFVTDWMKRLLSTSLFGKITLFFLLSIGTVAALLAWSRPAPSAAAEPETKQIDSIVAGIVLGGVLALYTLFLWIQLGHLWVGQLPVEFRETEKLVKSGFWQLLFLTVLNIGFAFTTYRKTVPAVQRLLGTFTVASFLLLASAGYRMALYVIHYGLSYEKFFASYTVAFCAMLLLWLVSRFFTKVRADVARFAVMLFLWMYAVLAVFPVEQVILRANVALSQRESSRIRLFELTMLSPDVLGLVLKYQKEGVLEENNPFYSPDPILPHATYPDGETPPSSQPIFDWGPWIQDRTKIVKEKAWYELNLTNLLTKIP